MLPNCDQTFWNSSPQDLRLPSVTTIAIPQGYDWRELLTYIMKHHQMEMTGGLGPSIGMVRPLEFYLRPVNENTCLPLYDLLRRDVVITTTFTYVSSSGCCNKPLISTQTLKNHTYRQTSSNCYDKSSVRSFTTIWIMLLSHYRLWCIVPPTSLFIRWWGLDWWDTTVRRVMLTWHWTLWQTPWRTAKRARLEETNISGAFSVLLTAEIL